MSVSGATCCAANLSFCFKSKTLKTPSSSSVSVLPTHSHVKSMRNLAFSDHVRRGYGNIPTNKCSFEGIGRSKHCIRASFGDSADETTDIFPRIHIRDPYKRLGISREASQEEIQAARNFLMDRYASHKASFDAIESAYDRIIFQSLLDRRKPKRNLVKKLSEVRQSPSFTAVTSRFQVPKMMFVIKTALAFIVLGILTVLFPTEDGPTLQVAISLVTSIYFLNVRYHSPIRAIFYGFATFFVSWLLGTFFVVSIIPPLLRGPRSFEVTSSLVSYVFLWASSTYLAI